MIDARAVEIAIVDGLKRYVGCEVVRANQNGAIPAYPYGAYTITTPVQSRSGTHSVAADGTRYMSYSQVWSFTWQADDPDVCMEAAMRAWDWFSVAGLVHLSDNGIVVLRLGNINNRDNLISIQYEHRNGFDVTFRLLHTVTMTENEVGGYIETANIEQKEE